MTIGVTLPSGDTESAPNLVDELIAQARQAADAGLKSVWFSQLPLSQDAITVAALAGREVPGIEYPPPIRHQREYLTVLRRVFAGEAVDFDGETIQAHVPGPSTVGGG